MLIGTPGHGLEAVVRAAQSLRLSRPTAPVPAPHSDVFVPDTTDPDLGLLAGLMPASVVLRQCGPQDPLRAAPPPLLPAEHPAVARAVPARQAEFALGRHCARGALQALCGQAPALPARTDRSPQWPTGVVGSITHDDGLVAAAVAWARDLSGIGIDTDRIERFDEALAPMVCAAGEQALWGAPPAAARQRLLALVFCVKEAVYKAQYPMTAAWLDFADLQVRLRPEAQDPTCTGGHWQAVLQRPVGAWAAGHLFEGCWASSSHRVAAAALLLPGGGSLLGPAVA